MLYSISKVRKQKEKTNDLPDALTHVLGGPNCDCHKQPLQETLKGKDIKDAKTLDVAKPLVAYYSKSFDILGRCSLCNGRVVKQLEDGAVAYCEKCGATCKPEDLLPVIPMQPNRKFLRETTYPYVPPHTPVYPEPINPWFPPYTPSEPIYPWRHPYDIGDPPYYPPYFNPIVIC